MPFVPGVVLIGDAAGHDDPIIGQGLSIAYRDVRIVRDLMSRIATGRLTCFDPTRRSGVSGCAGSG